MSTRTDKLHIEGAYREGAFVFVYGWYVGEGELHLLADRELQAATVVRRSRPDVVEVLALSPLARPGFVLTAEVKQTAQQLSLSWGGPDDRNTTPVSATWLQSQGAPKAAPTQPVMARFPFGSALWRAMVANLPVVSAPPGAAGWLDGVHVYDLGGNGFAHGWVTAPQDCEVWLETAAGDVHSLHHAYRNFRDDTYEFLGATVAAADAQFLMRCSGLQAETEVQLKLRSHAGISVLSQTTCTALQDDPVAVARKLFAVETPITAFSSRVCAIDRTILEPLIAARKKRMAALPHQVEQLGEAPRNPQVSLIIPLYRRTDMVEHQLLEFARDPWLTANAEIIYVVDDPQIVMRVSLQAHVWHSLHGVPLRWVYGGANRGFAGANNLGAHYARAQHLVFLNSDVFPQEPGWLEALLFVLTSRPDVGAVAPRLLFADGSLQHAGMAFADSPQFGVWLNMHPRLGLDPRLDDTRELTLVDAVTGACLAMRRADFERVGGWDERYLIGDFEDSDLCLKLLAQGLRAAYLPTVQLTHLERQTVAQVSGKAFRQLVTLYNAAIHKTRWDEVIRKLVATSAAKVGT